jgi:hypothetical protein
MKSRSPWHTNAAVCAQAFIKLAEIRQLAKAFGVNLLDERVQDEEHGQYVLRFACAAIAIIIIFRKQELHDSINRQAIGIAR